MEHTNISIPTNLTKIKDSRSDTFLHMAASRNKVKVVRRLINAGANIELKNSGGYTPLHYSIFGNNILSFDELIKHGADIDTLCSYGHNFYPAYYTQKRGYSILHSAVEYDCQEILIHILKNYKISKEHIDDLVKSDIVTYRNKLTLYDILRKHKQKDLINKNNLGPLYDKFFYSITKMFR